MIEQEGFPKGKGIEDFGNFNEGFCFRLNIEKPAPKIYVICAKDLVRIIKFNFKL